MNIERRGDTFKIRISAGKDSSGKRIVIRETYSPNWTTPTGRRRSDSSVEKEVQQYALDLEHKVKDGRYNTSSKMTFREYADVWREQYADKKLQKSTVSEDWRIFEKDFFPQYGHKPISEIRVEDMQRFTDSLQAAGLKVSTIRRRVTAVSSVFSFAAKRRVIEFNPCDYVEFESSDKQPIQCFTADECKRFLAFLEEPWDNSCTGHGRTAQTGTQYVVRAYTRTYTVPTVYRVFFTLAIFSGMRRGEILALTWEDVDFTARTISITKSIGKAGKDTYIKGTKTAAGIRTLTLPPEVFRKLSIWKREQMTACLKLGTAWAGKYGSSFDENLIFTRDDGRPMDVQSPNKYLQKTIRRYNDQCENESDRLPMLHLHDLRHSAASILVESGLPITEVSRRLGHAKISTTLDIYSHASAPLDQAAADTLERIFSGDQTAVNG